MTINSALIIKILIVEYIIILGYSVYEKNAGRSLYYLGAIILSIGVLIGTK